MEKDKLKEVVRKFGKIFFPVVALLAIAAAGYFYMQLDKLQKNPQAIAQEENTSINDQDF
jgi:CHASE3 domain sensor protein